MTMRSCDQVCVGVRELRVRARVPVCESVRERGGCVPLNLVASEARWAWKKTCLTVLDISAGGSSQERESSELHGSRRAYVRK